MLYLKTTSISQLSINLFDSTTKNTQPSPMSVSSQVKTPKSRENAKATAAIRVLIKS